MGAADASASAARDEIAAGPDIPAEETMTWPGDEVDFAGAYLQHSGCSSNSKEKGE